jgi:hypothetical protein
MKGPVLDVQDRTVLPAEQLTMENKYVLNVEVEWYNEKESVMAVMCLGVRVVVKMVGVNSV